MVEIHSLYVDPPVDVGVDFPGVTRTRQDGKDEADINKMMARYKAMGVGPAPLPGAFYGDAAVVESYHEAQQLLVEAEEAFAALPSEVRAKFRNSPLEMLRFLADEANGAEAVKLGLLTEEAARRIVPPPVVPPVVPPAPPATPGG